MIEIRQKIKLKDYLAAQYLHLRPPRPLKWLGIVMILILFALLAYKLSLPSELEKEDYFVTALVIWTLAYFIAYLPYRASKTFKQNKLLHHEPEGKIDELGLHFSSDIGDSNIPWDHILKWKENNKLILLYPSDAQFILFPKTIFTETSLNEVRILLDEKVKKKVR